MVRCGWLAIFPKAIYGGKSWNQGLSLQEVTSAEKINERDIRFAVRLSMIDPEIIEAILSGNSPEFFNFCIHEKTSHTADLGRPAQALWF